MGRVLEAIFGVHRPGREVLAGSRPRGRFTTASAAEVDVRRPGTEVVPSRRPREWFINTVDRVAEPEPEVVPYEPVKPAPSVRREQPKPVQPVRHKQPKPVQPVRHEQPKPVRTVRLPQIYGD